jgi:hypothetical protein
MSEIMIAVIMLMYTVSLELQLPACVTIHNQCSNTELVSPVYFGNGSVCPKLSGQQIDISTKMNACFEINAAQDDFEGALLFKLQRYSNKQHNMGALTTETSKNEVAHVHILVAWKVKNAKPFACVVLVEHTKELAWNESELKKLYYENCWWLKEYDDTISDAWLMSNNMILKTSFKARDLDGKLELSVSISEEEKDDYAIRPFCIDLKR